MNCQSCRIDNGRVHYRYSMLFPDWRLALCEDCDLLGYEPREIIILAARYGDREQAVSHFVKDTKYWGRVITAAEIMID